METLEGLDIGTLYFFERQHREWLTPEMIALTRIGDAPVVLAVMTLIVAGFLVAGRRWTALLLLASSLTGLGIAYTTKNVVNRPRPDVGWDLVAESTTASFPSGHSCNSMASYFAAALLVSRRLQTPWRKILLIVGVFLLCVLIGVSRMYLGKHYLTDVVAGWSLGLSCALIAYCAEMRWVPSGPPPPDPAEGPFLV